jgi:hypothetical protein
MFLFENDQNKTENIWFGRGRMFNTNKEKKTKSI